jgi:hypothetical protein
MADRTLTAAGFDRLRAQFNPNAWSGRIEGGYRFRAQRFGITPYAAGRLRRSGLSTYAEQAATILRWPTLRRVSPTPAVNSACALTSIWADECYSDTAPVACMVKPHGLRYLTALAAP